MILYIDTTDFNKVTFAVSPEGSLRGAGRLPSGGKKTLKKTYKIDPHRSHETLGKFDEFLRFQKIRNPQSAVKKIVVNKGPGSYTGVRIGVTVAQALGFAWDVPVQAVAKDKFIIR